MQIVKNPFHLIGKMRNYSWQGLLVHISALLGGSQFWKFDWQGKKVTTEQWGFLDFALLTGPIKLLVMAIHQNKNLILFFHTAGLPILFALYAIFTGLEFIKELITSTLTYALSWPVGIGALFIQLNSEKPYSAMGADNIPLHYTSTLFHPNINEPLKNPLSAIINLNVNGFRTAGLLSAPLIKRLYQSFFLLQAIFNVPHTLVNKFIDLIDSNPLTKLISYFLFPIRLALTLLASTLKAINSIAHGALDLLAMPIVLIVHAISLPFYKAFKTELNTLEIKTNDPIEEANTTFQKLSKDLKNTKNFKEALETPLIGDVTLVKDSDDEVQYFLEGNKDNQNYRIELTQKNSPIVLKALHHNAFKWASHLHQADQLNEVIEVLNDLSAPTA